MAVCVWAVLILGLVLGLLPRGRIPRTGVISAGILVILAVLSAISSSWALDDGAAIDEAVRVAGFAGLFGLVLCASRLGEARAWLRGIAVGIAIVTILALLSRLIPALPGGDEDINRYLPAAQGRLSYPIGYWNGLSALAAVGIVLFSWFGVTGRSMLARAASIAVIPLMGLAIYLASSRGGLFAMLIGLTVLVIAVPRRPALLVGILLAAVGSSLAVVLARAEPALLNGLSNADARTQGAEMLGAILVVAAATGAARLVLDGVLERLTVAPRAARIGLAAAAVVVLVGLAISDPPERLREFKEVPAADQAQRRDFIASHLTSGSGSGRWQYWGVALDAFGDEPVHGIGAGEYAAYWNQHAPINGVTGSAHSLYLEQLGELGLGGLICVLGFVLIGPISAMVRGDPAPERAAAVAVVATGIASSAIDWSWDLPAVFAVVLVAIGLLAGPALGPFPIAGDRGRTGRRALTAATITCGLVTIALAGSVFLSDRLVSSSQAEVRDADLSAAADDARDAIALQPWSSEPRLQLALVQEQAADLGAAAATAREAADRAADDWSIWLVRARIATREGHVREAERYLAEARRLNPRAPLFNPSLEGPLPSTEPVVPQPSS
jgi:O-Antigen ligase